MTNIIIKDLASDMTAEVTGKSVKDCLMAVAQRAESGWAVEGTITIYYKGTDKIQSLEIWFAGGGMVYFDHVKDNHFWMVHQ